MALFKILAKVDMVNALPMRMPIFPSGGTMVIVFGLKPWRRNISVTERGRACCKLKKAEFAARCAAKQGLVPKTMFTFEPQRSTITG